MSNTFFNGMGASVPSTSTLRRHQIFGAGDFAAVDILNECSFVFIDDVSQQAAFPLSPADVAALQEYYNAGGVILLGCDEAQFATCPAFMNQILDRLVTDLSPSVRFSEPATTVNPETCTQVTGAAGSVLATPNDLTAFFSTKATTLSVPSSDAACIVGDAEGNCIAAQAGQIVLFGDLNPFVPNTGMGAACINDRFVQDLGENFGRLIYNTCAAGGAGGYAHVFPFDGTEIEVIFFEDGHHYLLYSAAEFRVTIGISGIPESTFITSVGITLGSDQLLATEENGEPVFRFNGQIVSAPVSTLLGELETYEPDTDKLKHTPGALSQLSRYVDTGIKVNEVFNVVAGVHPGKGVFFNVEVKKFSDDTGLLTAADSRRRDFRLPRRWEVESLF